MKPVYWLAALPVIAFFTGGWLNGLAPTFVLGIPFLMLWNVSWLVLTSLILLFIDRRHPLSDGEDGAPGAVR